MIRRAAALLTIPALLALSPADASPRRPRPAPEPMSVVQANAEQRALAAIVNVWGLIERQAANGGDCHAIARIVRKLDPANADAWLGIIWHESSRGMWAVCRPSIRQLSGGPGAGLTQQTLYGTDGTTDYWRGLYPRVGCAWTDWADVTCHMKVAVLHRREHGWSAWNGAYGSVAPAEWGVR